VLKNGEPRRVRDQTGRDTEDSLEDMTQEQVRKSKPKELDGSHPRTGTRAGKKSDAKMMSAGAN